MKTLRYLLSLIAILSVVSVSAATFGKPHQRQKRGIQYTQLSTSMPTLAMSSLNTAMMNSGSTLPMAAVSGTTTTEQMMPSRRRAKKDESNPFEEEGGGTEVTIDGTGTPLEPGSPIGDAAVPMMLMIGGYVVWRARRRKVAANMRQE